jgi:NADPH2:quinone reductase
VSFQDDRMWMIRVDRFGGPDVLTPVDAPDPVAGPGQVVIAVEAIDVLFLDTVIRRGAGGPVFAVRPPYVPGSGVAGRVDGRAVLAETDGGGYASRVVVDESALIAVPDGVDLRDAAALLHDGRTAYGLLETTPVRPGDWVLVTAAGGGLGLLLVRLARAAGGHVVAAAGGTAKLAAASAAGAEATVDYTTAGWPDDVRKATGGAGPDVVFDGAGGELGRVAFGLVAPGGRFSAHGAPGGFTRPDPADATDRNITVRGIEQVQLRPADARRLIVRALAEGAPRPVIGAAYPLDEAARAHAAIESRTVVGKTLLIP